MPTRFEVELLAIQLYVANGERLVWHGCAIAVRNNYRRIATRILSEDLLDAGNAPASIPNTRRGPRKPSPLGVTGQPQKT